METPNREPQEYSRNIMEYKDPGRYIPIIFLLYSWGSLFGVPIRVPLIMGCAARCYPLDSGADRGAFPGGIKQLAHGIVSRYYIETY